MVSVVVVVLAGGQSACYSQDTQVLSPMDGTTADVGDTCASAAYCCSLYARSVARHHWQRINGLACGTACCFGSPAPATPAAATGYVDSAAG